MVYAIGDVHGRVDLLDDLLAQICRDVLDIRPSVRPHLVLLGDYIDRGRDSRAVIDRLVALKAQPGFEVRALKGNHEEQMLLFLEDAQKGPAWLRFGAAETLASYGVAPPTAKTGPSGWEEVQRAFRVAVPAAHLDFLHSLELAVVCGDYLFVHAGVRPGLPLEEQDEKDLIWIRDEFLDSDVPFGKVVVHGHTPEAAPFIGHNRIGIDTGAYASGMLTAVRLYGEDRFILQTGSRS